VGVSWPVQAGCARIVVVVVVCRVEDLVGVYRGLRRTAGLLAIDTKYIYFSLYFISFYFLNLQKNDIVNFTSNVQCWCSMNSKIITSI